MYRWQTLVLARAESILKDGRFSRVDTKLILDDVAEVLYQINQRYFPDPRVREVSTTLKTGLSTKASHVLEMSWSVENRTWEVIFAADGVVSVREIPGLFGDAPPFQVESIVMYSPLACDVARIDTIFDHARWLLLAIPPR